MAFNFPELIQTLFFSGATSAFLVPVCVRYMKDHEDYSSIYSTFINLAIVITVSILPLFLAFSHGIVSVIAPGFSPEARQITKILFIIMCFLLSPSIPSFPLSLPFLMRKNISPHQNSRVLSGISHSFFLHCSFVINSVSTVLRLVLLWAQFFRLPCRYLT